jgi:hypothetical protein
MKNIERKREKSCCMRIRERGGKQERKCENVIKREKKIFLI